MMNTGVVESPSISVRRTPRIDGNGNHVKKATWRRPTTTARSSAAKTMGSVNRDAWRTRSRAGSPLKAGPTSQVKTPYQKTPKNHSAKPGPGRRASMARPSSTTPSTSMVMRFGPARG